MIVKRRPFPIRSLAELEDGYLQGFKAYLDQAKRTLRNLIADIEPHYDEYLVEGISLKRSLDLDPITTAQIRKSYGAPVTPEFMYSEAQLPLLLKALPLTEGSFFANYRPIEVGDYIESSWAWTPSLNQFSISVGGVGIVSALEGRKQTVKIVKLGLDSVVVEGVETVLLCRLLGLPALEVKIYEGVEAPAPKIVREYDLESLVANVRGEFPNNGYFIQPSMEPLAEEARKIPSDSFVRLMGGEPSQEEGDADREADVKDRARVEVWLAIYNDLRRKNKSEEEATKMTEGDPAYLRIKSLSLAYKDQSSRASIKWERVRKGLRLAFEEVKLADPDFDVTIPIDWTWFWELATVQQRVKGMPDLSVGPFGNEYEEGRDVEIWVSKDRTWEPAIVIGVESYAVKVRRTDGQLRRVSEAGGIRKKQYLSTIDTYNPIGYNYSMDEIRVERFGVVIPTGSNSLRIEDAIGPITDEMNRTPLQVNVTTWIRNLDKVTKEVETLTRVCREMTGNPTFRPNASADCIKEFYDKRGCKMQKVTPGGKPSMDKEVLIALAGEGDELASHVVAAREAISRLSQLNSWEEFARAGKVQANWDSLGTPMGRYTADGPNLQNRIVEIRETIEPVPGWSFLSWDLGSAEYVVWSSLSGDPVLAEIFNSGRDMHTEMVELLKQEITDLDMHGEEPRQYGKTVNFAILYQMLPWTLAKKLGCTVEKAQQILDAYKKRAQVAVGYMNTTITEARHTGRVATKYGRYRDMPILLTARGNILHEAAKTCWHHVNCGTAAEILKIKTIRVVNALTAAGLYPNSATVALNMHDELILMVRDEDLEQVREIGGGAFRKPIEGILPFKVTEKVGKNWLEISK